MTQERSQPGIIGEWKLENWQYDLPDLTIRADATFLMRIDKTERIVRFMGHDILDDEYTGIWTQPDNKHLTFWPDAKRKIFFPFNITRLTKHKMTLRLTALKNRKGLGVITYIRLKKNRKTITHNFGFNDSRDSAGS